jgi:2-polyprenyl-6-methoxyphenol hydroxylase-like FAD-dependent oxidoreductase
VIVGGGFGGLAAAQELRRADVDVRQIDPTDQQGELESVERVPPTPEAVR